MEPNRREFIRQLSITFGSLLFIPACDEQYSPWRFLSEEEAGTIIAITEQIIPADDFPGASDANVINFIDKQLAGPYARFQDDYRKGIPAVNNMSLQKFGLEFTNLDWDRQTLLLQSIEKGEAPEGIWTGINPQAFFRMVRNHTMQGFYGSPRHGGNKNYVSYKMLKIDYPHVIGQNRYTSGCTNSKSATL